MAKKIVATIVITAAANNNKAYENKFDLLKSNYLCLQYLCTHHVRYDEPHYEFIQNRTW